MISPNKVLLVLSALAVVSCKTDETTGTSMIADHEVQAQELEPDWQKFRDFFATGVENTFVGERGIKIAHIKFDSDSSRPIIVIASGMTENYRKYQELIYEFDQAGFSVYSMDNRGMGASGREIANHQLVHVLDINDYHKDFDKYLQEIVPADGRRRFLYTHSTGGFIGSNFVAINPGYFSKVVLSSPLFEIYKSGFDGVADAIIWTRNESGQGTQPARDNASIDPDVAQFGRDSTTHSRVRFNEYIRIQQENPDLIMVGPTNEWVSKMTDALSSTWFDTTAAAFTPPLLIFQAEQDVYVKNELQDTFCARAKDCNLIRFAGAYHELYRELDEIRKPGVEKIIDFFKN